MFKRTRSTDDFAEEIKAHLELEADEPVVERAQLSEIAAAAAVDERVFIDPADARCVGPEARVGICVERSLEMIVGLLGILKAGGAYVPIDPRAPKARVAALLEAAEPVGVVGALADPDQVGEQPLLAEPLRVVRVIGYACD